VATGNVLATFMADIDTSIPLIHPSLLPLFRKLFGKEATPPEIFAPLTAISSLTPFYKLAYLCFSEPKQYTNRFFELLSLSSVGTIQSKNQLIKHLAVLLLFPSSQNMMSITVTPSTFIPEIATRIYFWTEFFAPVATLVWLAGTNQQTNELETLDFAALAPSRPLSATSAPTISQIQNFSNLCPCTEPQPSGTLRSSSRRFRKSRFSPRSTSAALPPTTAPRN
jgi:hypothetical protein